MLALKDLPPYLPKAFLAIEDRRFYAHYGVDPMGVGRAVVANVTRRGISQGASTITQQLAKNLFLTQERTVHRKLQELMLALWLERKFTKTEILELYLNRVYFGAGSWGIEQAAQRYFGKSARQVSLAEAALLAGLVKSPSQACADPKFRWRKPARADRARGNGGQRLHQSDGSEKLAHGEAAAYRCAVSLGLGELRRRLGNGRRSTTRSATSRRTSSSSPPSTRGCRPAPKRR